ncbi:hypothetical protein [Corynebacterium otitidis]|uniref:Uncharacterized protein n=1 Tax=Corynebacterium otitidis ATCC 51513 TaxID=883169 RepID=I7IWC4_9CORY|nr:hypothetical protein [Corynebacterium otitidis]EJZ82491.1 hypothetical protein HMPREF9719_00554 [Corynebacterium otitidis ATCC 51513]CCI82788.1 hypothetical protein BN46_0030 [Corynebacterium otitidis ATCC 51513]
MRIPEALTFDATDVFALTLVIECGMRVSPALVGAALGAFAISRGARAFLQIRDQR